MIDRAGLDTQLARLLHERGRLELPLLQQLLAHTRNTRAHHGATLAQELVRRGVLSETEAVQFVATLAPVALESSLSEGERWAREAASAAGDTLAPGARPDETEGPAASWLPGARVGDYVVIERLGAGGMGVVFLCEHAQTKAKYALKTIAENAPEEYVKRFQREGQIQASIDSHPNVVRVHTVGRALGRHYIVMDVATGGDLVTRVEKGALAPREAAAVVRDIAKGLAHLHEKCIVHRDVKPANVLFDEHGRPKLVDFGVALVDGATRLTASGETVGTPSFMAPEQVLAHRDRIGPWTDVYALGAVLYYALTGELPFSGATAVEIMTRVVSDEPPSPRKLRPEVPPELDELCLRALSKEQAKRPTATELADALDALVRGRKSPAKKAPPRSLGFLWFVLGIAVGGVAMTWRPLPPAAPPAPPAAPLPDADRAAVSSHEPTDRAREKPAADKPHPIPALFVHWTAGEQARCSIGGGTTWNVSMPSPMTINLFRKLTFTWRAERVEPELVTIRSRVDALEFRYVVETQDEVRPEMKDVLAPMAFDSARAEDASSPLAKAIGGTFTFDLDPRSGRILAVRDVAAIQSAIYERVGEPRLRARHRIPELSSEVEMTQALDALLHVLPDEGATPGRKWSLPRVASGNLEQRAGMPLTVSCEFGSRDAPGGALVQWSGAFRNGAGWERAIEGSSSFVNGRARRVEVTEKLQSPQGAARSTYELQELEAR